MSGSTMAFDPSSGQVFLEWTVPGQPSDGQVDWYAKRRWPLRRDDAIRGQHHGPRSLTDMAMSSVIQNIDMIPAEFFKHLPRHILKRIRKILDPEGGSLREWKIFSKYLLDEEGNNDTEHYLYRLIIAEPREELACYTRPMSSASVDFITHLVIGHGCDFRANELVRLAKMPNLGALEFKATDGASPLSDRLIRGWAEVKDCFPVLRLLRIYGRAEVTQKSLGWVSKFPSLIMYDVLGERKKWRNKRALAAKHGWDIDDHGDTATRDQDWMWRYMRMLSPLERSSESSREPAGPVEDYLRMLLDNPRRHVRFVPVGKAPSLMSYLTDLSMMAQGMEQDMMLPTSGLKYYDSWGFWLYALAGQLIQDEDLKGYSTTPSMQAVKGDCLLPSRPFATLALGDHFGDLSSSNCPLTFIRRAIRDSARDGRDEERAETESEQPIPGGKHFSRSLQPVDADGNQVSMWSTGSRNGSDKDDDQDSDSENSSEEDDDDEKGAGPSKPSAADNNRDDRKALKKARKEAAIAKQKARHVEVGDLPSSDDESSDDDANGGGDMPANPNHSKAARNMAKGDVDEITEGVQKMGAPASRREREAVEAAAAKERYMKLQAQGKTDEAKADLARLKLIREQREAEAARRQAEKEEKEEQDKARRAEVEAREAKKREAAAGPKKGGHYCNQDKLPYRMENLVEQSMEDSLLQDRLREHAKAFDGLLSLIPAKTYYGQETSEEGNQKKKKSKKEAAAARRGKLDPDSELNRNAKEVMDERANNKRKLREMQQQDEDDGEEDEDAAEDTDHSGDSFEPVDGIEAEKPAEGLRMKKPSKKQKKMEDDSHIHSAQPTQKLSRKEEKRAAKRERKAEKKAEKKKAKREEQASSAAPESHAAPLGSKTKKKNKKKQKKDSAVDDDDDVAASEPRVLPTPPDTSDAQPKAEGPASSQEDGGAQNTSSSPSESQAHSPVFDTEEAAASTADVSAESATTSISSAAEKSKQVKIPADTTTLRARLAARIQALRAARKADGPDGKPIRTRQELIEARRSKQAQRKAHKLEVRRQAKLEEAQRREEALASNSPGVASPAGVDLGENLSFGRVVFGDGTQASRDLSYVLQKSKRKGPSDPKTALLKVQGQKKRLAELEPEKRADLTDKDTWLTARRRVEGDKIRDDEATLKKAVRRKEAAKKKSKKAWRERTQGVELAQKERQKKREGNIQKRRDDKVLGKAGKKKKKAASSGAGKKSKAGRPGFEGSFGVGGGRKK
ncbi:hypothetical protein L249_7505 [Ophiocordyceps polyrhachis-furcata BCC 54312]|uniref:Ribosomal RNA-processing protein 14/surfeit locus protein 6 C-terminal domain-containing protein n=1 Tax=Ophiocordyceps polyrhachis-furcata BCC 54312 TaxID=1330021 RepID=A0A367LAX1_9HYPO|nr:hypothetical protein L249_7505 [Ophiocordyceps polyrhachis-furcata BCC 54312]